MLENLAGPDAFVDVEVAYRPLPEYITAQGSVKTYHSAENIPLPMFANANISVDAIFP